MAQPKNMMAPMTAIKMNICQNSAKISLFVIFFPLMVHCFFEFQFSFDLRAALLNLFLDSLWNNCPRSLQPASRYLFANSFKESKLLF